METKSIASKTAVSSFSGCKCGGQKRGGPKSGCNSLTTDTPADKPDLAIYSQLEELQKGAVPDWNSPDIVTNNWGPFQLMEEALVKVRNLSATVPAINAKVHYYISPFGIGTQKTYKLTKTINLAPNSETELRFPLDPDTRNGDPRVGVHFVLEHPHDPNSINNSGSQVHDGAYTSESGRSFSLEIPVMNDSNFSREIQLSIMPTDLSASLSLSNHHFMPYEQIQVRLTIEVPAFLNGAPDNLIERAVTVVGRTTDGILIGGATRLLRINN